MRDGYTTPEEWQRLWREFYGNPSIDVREIDNMRGVFRPQRRERTR